MRRSHRSHRSHSSHRSLPAKISLREIKRQLILIMWLRHFHLSQRGSLNDVQRDGFWVRGVVEPTSGTPCVWRLSCCSYYKAETWQTSSRSRCSSPDNPTNHNQPRYPRDQGQCSVQFPRFRPSLMARRGWAALFGLTAGPQNDYLRFFEPFASCWKHRPDQKWLTAQFC
jgi:hypothetical protein